MFLYIDVYVVITVGSTRVPVGIVDSTCSLRVRVGGAMIGLDNGAATMPVALTWLMM